MPRDAGVMDYRTVSRQSETELEIKRSRFIGRCFPVADEEQALTILAAVKKQHWDARHNCYAYAVGERMEIARYSDDGEPAGTAGLPMMEVLRQTGVTNALCVVTRYFGGVLLGTGGLVRAYTRAASDAVQAAGLVDMRACVEYRLNVPYALWGSLEGMLRASGQLGATEFGAQVQVQAFVQEAEADAFEKALIERFDAKLVPVRVGMTQKAFEVK